MITIQGKRALLAAIAGQDATFGSAVSLGVGTTPPSATDTGLRAETLRLPVVLRSPDFIGDQVFYKATLPADVAGKFYEVGLCRSSQSLSSNVLYGNTDEEWVNGVQDAAYARVGLSAVRVDAASSGNKTASIDKDISISQGGIVSINYFVGSNVSSSYIRLRTNTTNYYHYALPVTAGYNTVSVPLTSFAPTGAPSAENITSVVVYLASTSGGASQLHLDSLTVRTSEEGGDLLVRQVLASPIEKAFGIEQDIEIPLTITI